MSSYQQKNNRVSIIRSQHGGDDFIEVVKSKIRSKIRESLSKFIRSASFNAMDNDASLTKIEIKNGLLISDNNTNMAIKLIIDSLQYMKNIGKLAPDCIMYLYLGDECPNKNLDLPIFVKQINCNNSIELPSKTYIANEFHDTENLSDEQLSLITNLPQQVIFRSVYSLIVHYATACSHHIEQHGKGETVKLIVGERDSNGEYNGTGYDSRFEFEILANDEYIRPALAKGYLFDKYNIMAAWPFVKKGDTVIDVGANIGTFCVPIASAVGETGKVYAFEPQKRIFSLLKNNIKLNHASQIIPVNAAAGHMDGVVNLSDSVPDGESVGKSLKEIETSGEAKLINYGGIQLGESGEKCRMLQLDGFIDKESASNISLIKVDVEGAEPIVFYGAMKIIKKYTPVILFEKNFKGITDDMRNAMHLNAEEANFDILNYCRKIGYSILVILPKENFMIVYSDNNKLIEHSDVYIKQNKSNFNAYGYTVYFYKKKKSW